MKPKRQPICFPYVPEIIKGFGYIDRPKAEILLIGPQGRSVKTRPYVDMGADHSLYPESIGKLLEVEVPQGKLIHLKGLTGQAILAYLHTIRAQLAGATDSFDLPVAFVLSEAVPHLLGRMGILDAYEVLYRPNEVCFLKRRRKR